MGDSKLAGLREMRAAAASRAARVDRKKVARLAEPDRARRVHGDRETIARLRAEADALPACSAAAGRLRQAAAVLAIEINAYGRTGDVARWRLGVELVREPWGAWRLYWEQGKTATGQAFDELWPEVGEVLDELILAGRPRRYAGLRYGELAGRNWLTLEPVPRAARYPSQLVREAIGVPLHDLRTLIADTLRRSDPAKARHLIAAMLGHAGTASGEAYRAECEGDATALKWRDMRGTIADGGLAA